MLDFNDASIDKIVVHKIGNKYQEEDLVVSESELKLKDEILYDLLSKFFLKSFTSEEFFKFTHQVDLSMNEVCQFSKSIFENPDGFHIQSVNLAKHLYECTNHPNIKSGELYVVHFTNCKVGEDWVDAVGVFKSENKETFLKVYENPQGIDLDYMQGVNINKLDKGCLVYQMDAEQGYRVSIIDKAKGTDDVAKYWKQDFLGVEPREDQYYHTANYLDMCKGFVNEVFNEENNVEKADQMLMLDKSINFFKANDTFDSQHFKAQVMTEPEVIEAFENYQEEYQDKNDVHQFEEFDISSSAIKSQNKNFKSVIKLDNKFHVYVHGGHDRMDRGFDEEKGMKYYKLYYEKEK